MVSRAYEQNIKTKIENIDRYSYSHAKIEIDVTDKIANFKKQENLEYWVKKLNEKLKGAMAGYNYRYRDDGMKSAKVSILIGLDASLFKRGEGDKWNKRELFVGELYSNSVTTNEKNIKVDVDKENFGAFSNAIRTMFGSPKKESVNGFTSLTEDNNVKNKKQYFIDKVLKDGSIKLDDNLKYIVL